MRTLGLVDFRTIRQNPAKRMNHDDHPGEIHPYLKPHLLHAIRTSALPADMVARIIAELALEDAPPLPSSLAGEDSDPRPSLERLDNGSFDWYLAAPWKNPTPPPRPLFSQALTLRLPGDSSPIRIW
jgi:hypothetical protein